MGGNVCAGQGIDPRVWLQLYVGVLLEIQTALQGLQGEGQGLRQVRREGPQAQARPAISEIRARAPLVIRAFFI